MEKNIETETRKKVQKRLIDLMALHNMTESELATKSQVDITLIQELKQGKIDDVPINTLHRICTGMGILLPDFFDDSLFM